LFRSRASPGPMSGRNWIQRRINVEAIRNDPGLEQRRLRDAADQPGSGWRRSPR
jgi:hypothetical protein